MANLTFTPPADGAAVTMQNGRLCGPDRPVIPFIIGDGTGPEIWAAASRVIDAAVAKAYQGRRSIAWYEVFAGQKSFDNLGTWLPNETVEAFRTYLIGIKGPLTTPVGGGIRSLNVTLRQDLDLFVCLRPVRYFNGIETPVKAPEKVDMAVFRENTEDIYAGIEFKEGTEDAKLFFDTMSRIFPDRMKKVRFPESSGFGIKPVSREGTERLVRAVMLSDLIAVHIKSYIGALSAFCGAICAACGAGAAITWLCGGTREQIGATVSNTLGNGGGIVCDGAKASCAAKISAAVDAAILGHDMAMQGRGFRAGEGLIQDTVEQTIASMGYVGRVGMKDTDVEILNIMIGKTQVC